MSSAVFFINFVSIYNVFPAIVVVVVSGALLINVGNTVVLVAVIAAYVVGFF